jgi:hypothetical protein
MALIDRGVTALLCLGGDDRSVGAERPKLIRRQQERGSFAERQRAPGRPARSSDNPHRYARTRDECFSQWLE